jgi:hypothetical protein
MPDNMKLYCNDSVDSESDLPIKNEEETYPSGNSKLLFGVIIIIILACIGIVSLAVVNIIDTDLPYVTNTTDFSDLHSILTDDESSVLTLPDDNSDQNMTLNVTIDEFSNSTSSIMTDELVIDNASNVPSNMAEVIATYITDNETQ